MVVAVARRLGYIGHYGADGFTPPKGGETYCSGIFNPLKVWTDPEAPRCSCDYILRLGLDNLEFGKDDPLPWFTEGNPTSKT